MLERFTDQARRAVALAGDEARMLNHARIGTGHLLLGLLREGEGAGVTALDTVGVSLIAARQEVELLIGRGEQAPRSGRRPYSPRARTVLEMSVREALRLGDNSVSTEHLVLALLDEREGVGAQVVVRLGGGLDQVRRQALLLHAAR